MYIDDAKQITGIAMVVTAAVGGLGAYIVRPILNSISPIGVALTCALTTGIASTTLFSRMDSSGKFVGLMIAYPVGLMAVNLLNFNVRFLDPTAAVIIGGILMIPMAVTALVLSYAGGD